MSSGSEAPFADFATVWRPRIEEALEQLLPAADEPPARLHEAMRYALFPGGKRLRPLLVLVGCRAVDGDLEQLLRAAAAVECLHTYSLVHDDLPCMDDDALRRGRPSCHTVYGEALALLAGDALLTLAFEGVSEAGAEAVGQLAVATGSRGMVGGQTADLAAEGGGASHTLDEVQWIHDRKTGALITASLLIGVLGGARARGPLPAAVLEGFRSYGDLVGRAFQIADDCLDLTGSAEELGKTPQSDLERDKLTWPALVGLEASQAKASDLAEEAVAGAQEVVSAVADWAGNGSCLDAAVPLLQDVARAAVNRRN
ncbi:MAG: farnesyl diphosphate synthase [Planctomycetota bacterium]|nr:farnesyl diphosphate synthase [Planctomycetota bacterium]